MRKGSKETPVIPCGVALIRRDRMILIAQRNPKDTFGSFWEFPGGKKTQGESFEECVVREIKEELGIEVSVENKFMDVRSRYRDRIIWLNFFLCSFLAGEPKPIECQKVRWVSLKELKNFKFPPGNDRVIRKLVKDFDQESPGD